MRARAVRNYSGVAFVEDVLRNYSIPYTLQSVDRGAPVPNISALLYTPGGAPNYYGWVMYPNIEAAGYLNRADVEALWAYQRATGARSVKFGAW